MAKKRRAKPTSSLSEAAAAMGRKGGRVMTEKKREANRARAKKRWADYATKIAKAK
jgi:hypothetical protein